MLDSPFFLLFADLTYYQKQRTAMHLYRSRGLHLYRSRGLLRIGSILLFMLRTFQPMRFANAASPESWRRQQHKRRNHSHATIRNRPANRWRMKLITITQTHTHKQELTVRPQDVLVCRVSRDCVWWDVMVPVDSIYNILCEGPWTIIKCIRATWTPSGQCT